MPKPHLPLELQIELDNFGYEADQIIESFFVAVKREQPQIIYHYTDDIGLRGILESGQLWLTDAFNLNDPSELRPGFSHAVDILNRKADDELSKTFAEQFAAFGSQGGIEKSAHYFICSFSSCGDDLGQWRAYADKGRGYALGFDGQALQDAFMAMHPSNRTSPITYQDDQLLDIQGKIIEQIFDLIILPRKRRLERCVFHRYMRELLVSLTRRALLAALLFKHQAYENEKEHRFLQIYGDPAPEEKFRARPYSFVRYIEFDWRSAAPEALKRIVVGPAGGQKASQFGIDCLRRFHDDREVEIAAYRIPYRAF